MGKRRRRSAQKIVSRRWLASVLAALGAAVIALVALALLPAPGAPTSAQTPSPISADAFFATPEPRPAQRSLSDVLPRLSDTDREFTIAIFGDSTGVSARGWQVLVPQWLGERYNREVTLHPWNRDAASYDRSWGLGTGEGAPIVIWNASSPGRDVAFARIHQSDMVPVDPAKIDLVFVNFGHTEKPDAAVRNVGSFMRDAATKYSNAAIVYLKQNPDHSESPLRETQRSNVYYLEKWAKYNNFGYIPVYDAIEATGRVDELIDEPTMIHPNDDGYRVWADAMIDRLMADGA